MNENDSELASSRLAAETFMPIMVEAFHDGLHEVASLSRWLLATLVPAVWLIHHLVIPREEQYLERRFGPEYARFKTEVRRWL